MTGNINEVKRGQKLTAHKVNQIIGKLNSISGSYSTDQLNRIDVGSFELFGIRDNKIKNNKLETTVKEIRIINNNWSDGGKDTNTIPDRTLKDDDLIGLTSIWFVRLKEYGTGGWDARVNTNKQIEGLSAKDWYFVKLYDVDVDAEKGKIEILKDHRYQQTVGGEGGGGGGGGGETQGAFRWSVEYNERAEQYYGTFKYCNFQFGRKTYQPTQGSWTIAIPEGGCTLYLYIYHSSPEAAIIVPQEIANTLDSTTIPLITVNEQGVITNDYRGMPVIPVWGTPEG